MRLRALVSVLFLATLFCVPPLTAQEEMAPGRHHRAQPFFFDALNFATHTDNGWVSRLDIYAHVPFNIVQFVKKDEIYYASYTLSAVIKNDAGDLIGETFWERTLEALDFERTNNPSVYDLSSKSLVLPPGEYNLELLFEDHESALKYRSNKRIVIREYNSTNIGISDIMLVSKLEIRSGKRQIVPQINPNMSIGMEGFFVYFELYNPLNPGTIRITYDIKRQSERVSRQVDTLSLKQGLNSFLTNINSKDFMVGGYTITATVTWKDDTSSVLARSGKTFVLEWVSSTGTPVKIVDLEDAIDQLQYFAKTEDIDYIRDAPNEQEMKRRFEEFWERNNPTPGSEVNTAMIEYYGRVAYANEHFGTFLPGWRSDRGMVFIMFGQPSATENHPFEADSRPYVIWDYFDIGKRFIFVDYSGFGDYRLLYPIWDERTRMR